ncbi:hypothetical protein HDV05_003259, partial [Chytridiales sp. JEL 0842]
MTTSTAKDTPPPTTTAPGTYFPPVGDLQVFPAPIRTPDQGNGFDVHVYYRPHQKQFAQQLYNTIPILFPTLKLFKFWEDPVGPHTLPMFEVDLCSPAEFGLFVPWILFARGELSVLVHPHSGEGEKRDHTKNAVWMGEKVE